jgi:hypothetical protein
MQWREEWRECFGMRVEEFTVRDLARGAELVTSLRRGAE